jgi:hypothetical protein
MDDVYRYVAFNGFRPAGCIRYWEIARRSSLVNTLNLVAESFGNRFTAVYERM